MNLQYNCTIILLCKRAVSSPLLSAICNLKLTVKQNKFEQNFFLLFEMMNKVHSNVDRYYFCEAEKSS